MKSRNSPPKAWCLKSFFLSSHIFLLYIYIYSYTRSNTYAVHQNRMLSLTDVARNGYRFGRKSSFLQCITPQSEPQMQQLHQALHWCSLRSGKTWAGTCNIPVKHPCSTEVTPGGRVGFPVFVTLPSALQRSVHTNLQNTHLLSTRVWRPETDTNLLLTLPQGSSHYCDICWA